MGWIFASLKSPEPRNAGRRILRERAARPDGTNVQDPIVALLVCVAAS